MIYLSVSRVVVKTFISHLVSRYTAEATHTWSANVVKICNFCNGETQAELQTFANGTKHMRITCVACKRFNGFAPQEHPDISKFVMPIGKYKNKTLSDIDMVDPDYLRWAAENMEGNLSRRIESFFEVKYQERKPSDLIW